MTALAYWVGGLATLLCICVAVGLRLRDELTWQRAIPHTDNDRAPVIELDSRRPQYTVPATWGDDDHLKGDWHG